MDKDARRRLYLRLPLIWVGSLITFVVLISFLKPPTIPGGTATAIAAVTGLLSLVMGLYQKSLDRKNGETDVSKSSNKT